MKKYILAFACVALAACSSKYVPLKSSFDEAVAENLMKEGKNTIQGTSILRLNDGSVVTCAGLHVFLIPDTAYASERINILYSSVQSGSVSHQKMTEREKPFEPNINYEKNQKKVQCDAQGKFIFKNIADGGFFVVSAITPVCDKDNENCQGGSAMRHVTVANAQVEDVSLSQPEPTPAQKDIY